MHSIHTHTHTDLKERPASRPDHPRLMNTRHKVFPLQARFASACDSVDRARVEGGGEAVLRVTMIKDDWRGRVGCRVNEDAEGKNSGG